LVITILARHLRVYLHNQERQMAPSVPAKKKRDFDLKKFLATIGEGRKRHGALISSSVPLRIELRIKIQVVLTGMRAAAKVVHVFMLISSDL